MATFTDYTGALTGDATLTNPLLAPDSGIQIITSSITLNQAGGVDAQAVSLYDGTLAPLGIGAGLLLTSGTKPGLSNTVGWFGTDNSVWPDTFFNGDADIDAVVNTVFSTQSYDATTLSFDFSVTDPNATSISFDIVFGSDEYPEWVDQFVDCAVVMVNGVNYALFNHDPMAPLSVVSPNLAAGYFQDNGGNVLPIEYDGVSHVLKIVAPIKPGELNHIKIGIADTGDHIYDSGIFIANLSAGTNPGSGVVSPTTSCSDGPDTVTGSVKAEYIDLKGGDDVAYAGGGDDIVVAGAGNDTVYGGSGADDLEGDAGDDSLDGGSENDTAFYAGNSSGYSVAYNAASNSFTVTDNSGGEGTDTLCNVEFATFSDGLYQLDAGSATGLTIVTPVTPPANTPGTVVISGVGAPGNTLTATVSDSNGLPGAVSYQWQASSDGTNWIDVGSGSKQYTVSATDAGSQIQVIASYTDLGNTTETPVSAAKSIQNSGGGDLVVTLMQIDAPNGSGIANPLTTLIQNGVELGLSPNMAANAIKSVLGLPQAVSLQSYDAFAILQGNPGDATALQVEQVAVQVAILTSLSDDDSGMNLMLAILDAAQNGQTLDLANVDDLSAILDIPAVIDPLTNKYPQPLEEILDRNKTMADGVADGKGVAIIENEWQDLLSIQKGIASTSIADLSINLNLAPTGAATANLPDGTADQPYTVSAAELLAGFSDPDGDALLVDGLSADNGTVTDNGDGSFTIDPTPGFTGPVELSYNVIDGNGGYAPASELFVIAAAPVPINHAPTGAPAAVLAAGTEDVAYTVSAADLLAGFSDADAGDTLHIDGLYASAGTVSSNVDGTWSITQDENFNGNMVLDYIVSDGTAGVAAQQGYAVTPVNDAPTGAATATLAPGAWNTPYTVSALALLAGFSDVEGDALGVQNLSASNGSVTVNGDGTFTITPTANYSGAVSLDYTVSDGAAGIAATQHYTLEQTGVTLNGSSGADILNGGAGDDSLNGLAGKDTLNGFAGNDTLNGGAASDKMVGGAGNDTYYVDATGDAITENAGEGSDTVVSTLAAWTLGANLENLALAGAAAKGTGNALDNAITGNDAANTLAGLAGIDSLVGGNGADTLAGGAGIDLLTGGNGADHFRFDSALNATSNADTIQDFSIADDTVQLENAVFRMLKTTGTLSSLNFHTIHTGESATTTKHFVLYDIDSGSLYYDADGSGAGAAVEFAHVGSGLALSAADFLVT